ncbi:serine/threonine-protein kinase [Nocardioides marinisabuli]|uniref:serine/threonine-protein kinase n=1 Tax=Nocardioides marinisabuli TaxID=419476 RepID=UPI002155D0F2|nr:serine/threonine-protein kinase [Nocardioides marinisabuli]
MSTGQRIPQRLGRYAVRRRIGSGGFATVWLAYDEHLDSPVAVKVLADNWTDDAQVRRRFLEEGRYLRRVESPHVVGVYDAGELDDGRPYLVMSYADQGTLADRLEIDGLTPAQSLEIVRQVGAGLTALHARDILHRDVKPANVLFRTVEGEVRAMLGDLGLGKALDVSSRLTMVAGSPSYVAPEQARAEAPDARADQYSLGAVAYLLLAGRPAFSHASLRAAADRSRPRRSAATCPPPSTTSYAGRSRWSARSAGPTWRRSWPSWVRRSSRWCRGPGSRRPRAVAAGRPRADPARQPALAAHPVGQPPRPRAPTAPAAPAPPPARGADRGGGPAGRGRGSVGRRGDRAGLAPRPAGAQRRGRHALGRGARRLGAQRRR